MKTQSEPSTQAARQESLAALMQRIQADNDRQLQNPEVRRDRGATRAKGRRGRAS